MFGFDRRILGLDIGSHSIKWSVFGQRKRPVILGLGMTRTPEGAITDGCITDRRALADALKQVIRETRMKLSKAYITLSSTGILARTIYLPQMRAAELRNAIYYQAEQLLYNAAKEYITDYRIIGPAERPGYKGIRVLIAGAPADMIEEYVDLIECLGMKPGLVDINGNSAARFLTVVFGELCLNRFAIVDLGASSAVVTIVAQGHPLFMRTVRYGMHWDEQRLAVNPRSCNKGQITFVEPYTDEQRPSNNSLSYIVNEIYRTVEYYRNDSRSDIDRIILVGGLSEAQGIDKDLTAMTGIECTAICRLQSASSVIWVGDKPAALYANVLGLALREGR
jgi:type IV pilus assembly protein PilM